MFERFTERARQVVILAQEEARASESTMISEGHILLGLLREEEGLAARILASLDVELRPAINAVKTKGGVVGPQKDETEGNGQLPFTPRAKKALELSLREALSLGHNYIGTEHILLGLVRDESGVAVQILEEDFSLTPKKVQAEVIYMLSGPSAPQVQKDPVDRMPASTSKQIGHAVKELRKDRSTDTLLDTAIMLARQYPDVPSSAISKAARALHD